MPDQSSTVPERHERDQRFHVRSFNGSLDSLEYQCESAEEGLRRLERSLGEMDAGLEPQRLLSTLERSLHVYEDVASERNRLVAYLAGTERRIECTVDAAARDALLGRSAALGRRAGAIAPPLDAIRKSLDRHSRYAAEHGLEAQMDGIERAVAVYRAKLRRLEQRIAD